MLSTARSVSLANKTKRVTVSQRVTERCATQQKIKKKIIHQTFSLLDAEKPFLKFIQPIVSTHSLMEGAKSIRHKHAHGTKPKGKRTAKKRHILPVTVLSGFLGAGMCYFVV
jgi:G3E family GTPase